jgi:hypothetical protein
VFASLTKFTITCHFAELPRCQIIYTRPSHACFCGKFAQGSLLLLPLFSLVTLLDGNHRHGCSFPFLPRFDLSGPQLDRRHAFSVWVAQSTPPGSSLALRLSVRCESLQTSPCGWRSWVLTRNKAFGAHGESIFGSISPCTYSLALWAIPSLLLCFPHRFVALLAQIYFQIALATFWTTPCRRSPWFGPWPTPSSFHPLNTPILLFHRCSSSASLPGHLYGFFNCSGPILAP